MSNRFNEATSVKAGDNLVMYAGDANRFRELAVSVLQQYMQDNLTFSDPGIQEYTQQIEAPVTNAFNILITNNSDNAWLILKPIVSFSSGTITLPAVANVVDNQQVLVNNYQYVLSSLTVAGNGASVIGEPSALSAYQSFTLKYSSADNTWYNVSN